MRYKFKIATLILLTITLGNCLWAQEEEIGIFIVEEMPKFNNGDPAFTFRSFLQSQIDLLKSEIPDSISGRIIIQFWVDSSGNVVDPVVLRGINNYLDSLAQSIVISSPKWTPGKQRGKNISVPFTFPVHINYNPPENNYYKEPNRKRKNRKILKFNYP